MLSQRNRSMPRVMFLQKIQLFPVPDEDKASLVTTTVTFTAVFECACAEIPILFHFRPKILISLAQ